MQMEKNILRGCKTERGKDNRGAPAFSCVYREQKVLDLYLQANPGQEHFLSSNLRIWRHNVLSTHLRPNPGLKRSKVQQIAAYME